MQSRSDDEPRVGYDQLARLTAAKWIANVALRWAPFFLFVLEDAFDATTTQLTLILGLAEMTGLSSVLVGPALDRGRERQLIIGALIMMSGSGIIGLGGTVVTFAVSFVLTLIGLSLITVSGHTWLSRRVRFARRGWVIGVFETSWAASLLVGAPIVAGLIELFGWRAPFVFVSVASAAMAWVVSGLDDGQVLAESQPVADASIGAVLATRPALTAVAMSAAIATAGLTTIVIVGTWLEDSFGVSTGEVGLTAMAFGAAELIASSSSARYADRYGKERTTTLMLVVTLAGLVVIANAGASFAIAVLGLAAFFIGFEYAIVTSFTIVSEAAPHARGRVLAANNAVGTLARGTGTIASGFLYERFGIGGPATLSIGAATLALMLLVSLSRA